MEESFGERSITFTLPLNWKIDPSLIYSIDYKLQILSVYLLFFFFFIILAIQFFTLFGQRYVNGETTKLELMEHKKDKLI